MSSLPTFQLIRRIDEPMHTPILRPVVHAETPLPKKYLKSCEIAGVVTTANELMELVTGPELLDMFRDLVAGTDISVPTKFASRSAGAARIMGQLTNVATVANAALPGLVDVPKPVKAPKVKEPKAPKAPKEPRVKTPREPKPKKESTGRRGRTSAFTPDRKIVSIVANPKKPGTGAHDRFAMYTKGMTVGTYLSLGGTLADIRWDVGQGFITVAESGK